MVDALVGVNYFAGWWEPLPNKWHRHDNSFEIKQGDDWRPDFPKRVPLLGCFNNQETMDKEIIAAADHNVDFFPILWYYNDPDREREPNSRFLNVGLDSFMNSPNCDRMKFFIEFCNCEPYEVCTDRQWQRCLEVWFKMLKHPGYMRVGERLVFKVIDANCFIKQNKMDIKRCHERLDLLRDMVRDAGLGEMLIGCGIWTLDSIKADNPIAELFDFTAAYMGIPPLVRKKETYAGENHPYEMLADFARAFRHVHCQDVIPHMPYLPGGWCPRPWQMHDKTQTRAYFDLPNKEQWTLELRRMKEDLAVFPKLGLPLTHGNIQPAFTCYAWNEFGEGGIIAPTQGDGYMKLECIKEIYGTDRK